jgi:trk system potassium uptake protein TrkA
MKIIIAGGGKIGHSVASILADEGHDITVIDHNSDRVSQLSNSLDVICFEGSATNAESLREAGAADADLLLAATQYDEVNMVCGISARHLGARHVIARIRDPEYLSQKAFLREALGLDLIVNPDFECAREIARILRFPSAVRVDTFSKGSVEIVEYKVAEGSVLEGVQMKDLGAKLGVRVLVSVVERGKDAFIPNGAFTLQAGDRLSITGTVAELRRFFAAVGQLKKPIRQVMIVGGSRTAVYLSRMLQESGMSVTVVEKDRERCDRLCDLLPDAHIVYGDATRSDVLLEDGLCTSDAFVALTGEDGDNIVTSLYARQCGVGKIVAKVNRDHFAEILEGSGLDSIVSARELIAEQLARYVRAMSNSAGSSMETLYRLADGRVEAIEFRVGENAACVGKPLRELKLKPNTLIAAVIRGSKSILPDGGTVIQPGDHAIVVSAAGKLQTLDDIVA